MLNVGAPTRLQLRESLQKQPRCHLFNLCIKLHFRISGLDTSSVVSLSAPALKGPVSSLLNLLGLLISQQTRPP